LEPIPEPTTTSKKRWLRRAISDYIVSPQVFWTFVGALITALSIYFASGMYYRPSIESTGEIIDLNYPDEVNNFYFNFFSSITKAARDKKLIQEVRSELIQVGIPKSKVDQLMPSYENRKGGEESLITGQFDKLSKDEQRLVGIVISKSMTTLMQTVMEDVVRKYAPPRAVLLVEVRNDGRADAEDVELNIKNSKSIRSVAVESQNSYTVVGEGKIESTVSFKRLSPKSVSQVSFWLDFAPTPNDVRDLRISLTYANGMTPVVVRYSKVPKVE
jgi:hypothetical protein